MRRDSCLLEKQKKEEEEEEEEGIVESQKKGEKLENMRKFKKAIKVKYWFFFVLVDLSWIEMKSELIHLFILTFIHFDIY